MIFVVKSEAPFAASPTLLHPILDQAAEGAVTLITTPAGYLMAENLAAVLIEHNRPAVWLRLGPEDRDPATFILSLMMAAQRLHPGVGAATLQLMKSRPGPTAGWSPVFARLGSELGEVLPASTALVIEQVHHLKESQIVLSLFNAHLLPALPPSFTTILISHQSIPSTGLSKSTSWIGVKELRVDARDGLALAKNAQADLSGEVIRRALALIEGRLAGLAGLFNAVQMLGPEFVQQAVYRSKTANDLLAWIVRGSLASAESSTVQALALALQLEYSHPQLIEAALGIQAVPAGPWFQPLQDRWSRVRQMWQAPLKIALRSAVDGSYTGLRRAADYLVSQRAPERAIDLYLQLGDGSAAARNIAGVSDQMMNLGQWDTLESWLGQLTHDSLQDWPRLVYMSGELAAARGNLEVARKDFSRAADLYLDRREAGGACESLLAESTLAAWQDDYDQAWLSARKASALAEANQQPVHQAWAAWQLGCLATGAGRLDESLAYFSKATTTVSNPDFETLFESVETLTLRQHELHQQREFHRQAYLDLEQAERDASNRLNLALHSQPENLDRLLSVYGWSGTPLIFKLKPPATPVGPGDEPARHNLWHLLRQGFWEGLRNIAIPGLAQSGQQETTGPARAGKWPEDAALDPAFPLPGLAIPGALSSSPAGPDASSLSGSTAPPIPAIIGPAGLSGKEAAQTEGPAQAFAQSPPIALPVGERLPIPVKNTPARDSPEPPARLDRPQPVGTETARAEEPAGPLLTAYLLGLFRVSIDDRPVEKWPGSRGAAVLKYLLVHRQQDVPREVLMEVFWPETDPESARNSLNVALHNLRQAFRAVSAAPIVIFEKSSYHFNREVQIWLDVDEFERHLTAGRQLEAGEQVTPAMYEYQVSASLYQGDFLAEDPYEEWPVIVRERLRIAYLDLLDRLSHIYFSQGQYSACAALCQAILERDGCREDAHCLLMRSFSRQGQHHLALRQYQTCREALRKELDVSPEPATTQLAERIRKRERV
ncbi:MAG TPA: BTAD domain-containing putative transcriptional regulator [Anaerolineales bacterium]